VREKERERERERKKERGYREKEEEEEREKTRKREWVPFKKCNKNKIKKHDLCYFKDFVLLKF